MIFGVALSTPAINLSYALGKASAQAALTMKIARTVRVSTSPGSAYMLG